MTQKLCLLEGRDLSNRDANLKELKSKKVVPSRDLQIKSWKNASNIQTFSPKMPKIGQNMSEINKLTSVFHVSSGPVIDDEFHHKIVKVAVDP